MALPEAHRDREALPRGIDAQHITVAVVPANLRKVVNLPERRKRAFRDYLAELIAQAAAVRASSANPPPGETALDSSPSSPALENLLQRGCATCRGLCCLGGGNHAYLSLETILGYMYKHPKQRPRQVLDAYLSFLPNKAYENSCVYQTKIRLRVTSRNASENFRRLSLRRLAPRAAGIFCERGAEDDVFRLRGSSSAAIRGVSRIDAGIARGVKQLSGCQAVGFSAGFRG